jgi:hypothetical protein
MMPFIEKSRSRNDTTKLRGLIAAIETEMSRLSGKGALEGSPSGELFKHWAALVTLLDLGQPPELRECLVCHQLGMQEATLCGYCWTKLEPAIRSNSKK